MIQYEVKITGRVQGVGFRYFVLQRAIEIGIKGWVKNCGYNEVVVLAQGNETEINTFIDYLQIGPTRARVNKISKYKIELLSDFDNFSVKY